MWEAHRDGVLDERKAEELGQELTRTVALKIPSMLSGAASDKLGHLMNQHQKAIMEAVNQMLDKLPEMLYQRFHKAAKKE